MTASNVVTAVSLAGWNSQMMKRSQISASNHFSPWCELTLLVRRVVLPKRYCPYRSRCRWAQYRRVRLVFVGLLIVFTLRLAFAEYAVAVLA